MVATECTSGLPEYLVDFHQPALRNNQESPSANRSRPHHCIPKFSIKAVSCIGRRQAIDQVARELVQVVGHQLTGEIRVRCFDRGINRLVPGD